MSTRPAEAHDTPPAVDARPGRPPIELDPDARQLLAQRVTVALVRARRSAVPTLAALTLTAPDETDPSAVVCASRRPAEPWFAYEQPDRHRFALATLGQAVELRAAGPARFTELAARWRALCDSAVVGEDTGPGARGPVAVGGFAFAPEGGGSPHWSAFAPGSLVVPEVALSRWQADEDGPARVHATLAALVAPDDTVGQIVGRLEQRLAELRDRSLPLADPDPAQAARVVGTMPPEHYESAVARAVERIRAGELEKIVLAREVQVHAATAHDPAAVLGVLREAFPSCSVFCVGRGDAAFVAASPELLIRREGSRASTLALAGSMRRSADPAVDDHLGEQLLRSAKDREEHAIVARRIERILRPRSVWITSAPEPTLVQVANIQHLATPIRAQLAEPMDAVELAGLMHPTPAVGGEPLSAAAPLIPALEGLDRGWYAGPVGWSDAAGDGEFCVALRCALLTGPLARCYAGVGVVRDSEPAAELAETEIKLAALLPVLAG